MKMGPLCFSYNELALEYTFYNYGLEIGNIISSFEFTQFHQFGANWKNCFDLRTNKHSCDTSCMIGKKILRYSNLTTAWSLPIRQKWRVNSNEEIILPIVSP